MSSWPQCGATMPYVPTRRWPLPAINGPKAQGPWEETGENALRQVSAKCPGKQAPTPLTRRNRVRGGDAAKVQEADNKENYPAPRLALKQ